MSASALSPNPRLWILGPWRDLFFFVLTPLWILPLVWWAKANFGITSFGAFALALGGVGHHLPGFIRAYTDPVLFRRFRTRFIIAPLFLLTVFAAFSLKQLHGLKLLVVLWGAWHGAMQVNGFLRIYDAKAGSISPVTARLDWAMCLAWFGAGLLHSSSRVTSILMLFYDAGGTEVGPDFFAALRMGWDALTAAITIAFLVNAWRETRAGTVPSPVKLLLMASSFGFWWFAMVNVYDPILGLLLFEVFHDVQYNTLVWVYNRGRVAQRASASSIEIFLFRPGAFRIALYVLLIGAYGLLGVFSDYSVTMVPASLRSTVGSIEFWTGLFTVSAFLHFYFDGFIWRVREKELRQGLGISREKQRTPANTTRPVFWHPPAEWKWVFFVVPALTLGIWELQGRLMLRLDQFRSIVRILPENWSLHYFIAHSERANKDYARAVEDYQRALVFNPDLEPAHAELADIYTNQERPDLAVPHYQRALDLDPLDVRTRDHFATALLMENRVADALPYLLPAASRAPNNANINYLAGAALMHEGRVTEAMPYLRLTLKLDPNQPRARAYLDQAEKQGP